MTYLGYLPLEPPCPELVSGSETVTSIGVDGWLRSLGDCAWRSFEVVEVLGDVGDGEGSGVPMAGGIIFNTKSDSFICLEVLVGIP